MKSLVQSRYWGTLGTKAANLRTWSFRVGSPAYMAFFPPSMVATTSASEAVIVLQFWVIDHT